LWATACFCGLSTPGGLSWALDPSFCTLMLPQFPEGAKSSWVGYNFVTCNDIKVALALPAGSSAPGLPLGSARVWLLHLAGARPRTAPCGSALTGSIGSL